MAVLALRDLKKHFGRIKALDGVNLTLEKGEFLAVLGPSGSGKSTLMRLVAGLDMPTSGDIVIDGQSVVGVPPQHRNVAMVFQSFALYPHMTVRDNILFPLISRKVPKEDHLPRLEKATQMLGVTDLLDRKPGKLSGGQKQRIALARALVRAPELFIFDEPLSALDAKIRSQARAELRELHRSTRITTLYVTHDQVEAMGLADRVALIHEGQLQQVGTPNQLYREPANLFVAGFVGSPPMNLLPLDPKTVCGIRPEHLWVNPTQAVENALLDLKVLVEHVEYLGSEWLVYGTIRSGLSDEALGKHVVARMPATWQPDCAPGHEGRFVGARGDVSLFDKTTGTRRASVSGERP